MAHTGNRIGLDRARVLFKPRSIDGWRVRAVIGAGLALLVLSCAGPYYERAAITKGWSGGGGVGVTAGERLMLDPEAEGPALDVVRDVSALGTGYVRYGWSSSACFYAQATGGYGAWNHAALYRYTPGDLALTLTDIQVGMKFRADRNGAVQVGIGLPGVLDIAYLHDFGKPLTANIGIGPRGLSLGVTHHLSLSPRLLQHTSLTVSAYPYDDPYKQTNRH